MDITPHVSSLEEYLTAVSATGDEAARNAAAALVAALEPAARLAIMSALAELAVEVTDALGDRVVEIRLDVGEVHVSVSPPVAAEDDLEDSQDLLEAGGEPSRITLRIPEELKARAERAADAQAVSLNTWLVQAVRQALRPTGAAQASRERDPRTNRLRGWVQA